MTCALAGEEQAPEGFQNGETGQLDLRGLRIQLHPGVMVHPCTIQGGLQQFLQVASSQEH